MRQRRMGKRRNRLVVDVGPFLSIIVCIIGIVVLLISGLVVAGGLQEADQITKAQLGAQIAIYQRILAAQQITAQLKAELAAIVQQINQDKPPDDVVAKAKQRLDELQKQLDGPDYLARVDLMRQIEKAKADLAAIQDRLKQLPVQIAGARQKASDAKGTVTIPLLTAEAKVKPIFIECHGAGLTVYRQVGKDIQQFSVRFDDIDSDSDLAGVIKDAADNAANGQVLNLLVRPDGVKAYDKTMQNVRKASAPSASVPIIVSGKIQFRVPEPPNP